MPKGRKAAQDDEAVDTEKRFHFIPTVSGDSLIALCLQIVVGVGVIVTFVVKVNVQDEKIAAVHNEVAVVQKEVAAVQKSVDQGKTDMRADFKERIDLVDRQQNERAVRLEALMAATSKQLSDFLFGLRK